MQIPTVTLEDLQAFHEKHFPEAENPHTATVESTATAEPTAHHGQAGKEGDLGYYPDGVKRTLTDEQIQIFRHSEIHTLLRARQLERDEAEYQARMDLESESPNQSPTTDKQEKANTLKRPAKHMDQTMSETLDYEENDHRPPPQGARKQSDVFSGRKIVSYED